LFEDGFKEACDADGVNMVLNSGGVIDLSAGGRSDDSRLQLNMRWCAVCMGFSEQKYVKLVIATAGDFVLRHFR
jgi:hypothetical protein